MAKYHKPLQCSVHDYLRGRGVGVGRGFQANMLSPPDLFFLFFTNPCWQPSLILLLLYFSTSDYLVSGWLRGSPRGFREQSWDGLGLDGGRRFNSSITWERMIKLTINASRTDSILKELELAFETERGSFTPRDSVLMVSPYRQDHLERYIDLHPGVR